MPNNVTSLDTNTYYPSKNIKIFPSSNAVDEGKIFTEYNGRRLTIDITDLNYVVSPNPEGYLVSLTESKDKVQIQPGIAIINGFEVDTNSAIEYRLPTDEEVASGNLPEEGYTDGALLCLHTLFDSLDNLSGNIQVDTVWYCEGIRVEYVSADDYKKKPNEYLLLAQVKPGTVKPNKDRFQRIDAKYILVKIKEDPETHVPPTQKTDLLTFINNFLKGYWVSKGGDNVYGPLKFKDVSADYYKEGFDFNDEDPLTSKVYTLSLERNLESKDKAANLTDRIVIKEQQDQDSNTNCIATNNSILFHPGKISDTPHSLAEYTSIEYTGSNKTNDTGSITKFYSKNGKQQQYAIHTADDKFLALIIADSKNGAGAPPNNGKVIYAADFTDDTATSATTYNYLLDSNGDIASYVNSKQYIRIKSNDPQVLFGKNSVNAQIILNSNNTLNIQDNVSIGRTTAGTAGKGNLQAYGAIVASEDTDAFNNIVVPDVVNNANNRKLKSGDVYGTQVWSAVYNDVSEVFDFVDSVKAAEAVGLVVAQDKNDLTKFTIADKNNTNIVGIISEQPGICTGGKGCTNGIPVALAGRIKVRYTGKVKPGDFVGLSKKLPGYVRKCKHTYKYRCGKTLRILDNGFIEVLVLL